MKISLLIIVVSLAGFISPHAAAQKKQELTEALILTKAGDTLLCLIAMEVQYGKRIEFLSHPDAEPEILDTEDISMVITTTRILESIRVGDREELMTLVVSGRVNLYNLISFKDASHGPTPGSFTSQSTTVKYVVRKDDRNYEVRRLKFKDDVSALFNDCPVVVKKILSKEYSYFDLEAIVREYNECSTN